MVRIFLFFSFSSFPISTHCSSLPLVGPHTLHFFPLQVSIPPLVVDLSPCLAPTTPIDLFVLYPYLYIISFFLYSISQSFSVSNTKTHDHRCWVLILLPWLTKQRCRRDWVLCWWVLFLFWWMSFDFVDGWWLMNGVCWWLMNDGWVSLVDEWWWRRWWLWLMVDVVVVGAVDVFWVVRYIILL